VAPDESREAVDKLLNKVPTQADQRPLADHEDTEREEKRDAKGLVIGWRFAVDPDAAAALLDDPVDSTNH
jgi:hypothetical protein